ncbi:hypothetical protein EGW08_003509, partial [Elysia chlorotica]
MPERKPLLALLVLIPVGVLYFSMYKIWPGLELQPQDFKAVTVQPLTPEPPTPRLLRISRGESEVRQVVFAKVHKAASTTVQNILLRFSVFRALNILLSKRQHQIGERTDLIQGIVPHPEGNNKTFDILCVHLIFNASNVAKFFSDSAIRIAILREPLKQTVSALAYYSKNFPSKILKRGRAKHPQDPINGFLRHPEDFYDFGQGPAFSYVNNRMSVDLGFDLRNFETGKTNVSKIEAFIRQVEEQFDLVLISDYFDESMVLMRRYLNWAMKDIIYIKRNAAHFPKDSVWHRDINRNATVMERFRTWNLIDYKLYEHFEPKFLDTIKQEQLFKEEV